MITTIKHPTVQTQVFEYEDYIDFQTSRLFDSIKINKVAFDAMASQFWEDIDRQFPEMLTLKNRNGFATIFKNGIYYPFELKAIDMVNSNPSLIGVNITTLQYSFVLYVMSDYSTVIERVFHQGIQENNNIFFIPIVEDGYYFRKDNEPKYYEYFYKIGFDKLSTDFVFSGVDQAFSERFYGLVHSGFQEFFDKRSNCINATFIPQIKNKMDLKVLETQSKKVIIDEVMVNGILEQVNIFGSDLVDFINFCIDQNPMINNSLFLQGQLSIHLSKSVKKSDDSDVLYVLSISENNPQYRAFWFGCLKRVRDDTSKNRYTIKIIELLDSKLV